MTAPSPAEQVLKTLFLQAPSFDGFGGGAGSRYQAKPERLFETSALQETRRII
jgi:hypothetical protein